MLKSKLFWIGVTGFMMFGNQALMAQEAVLDSETIQSDASQLKLPSDNALTTEREREKVAWKWREALTPFLRDTTLKLNIRNFYFSRQDGKDTRENDSEKISWAQGGSLALKSGKLYEVFSVGSELFTSQNLYGPRDKDGALLLEPGQEGYTVIGVANPRLDYEGHALSLYRQRHELPYVNSQENRMTPNTFESYSYAFLGEGEAPPFQVGLGYLDKIKKRNTEDFVSMSEGAGVQGHDRGMPWIGARVRPLEGVKITAVNYSGIDVFNIFYSDVDHTVKFSDDWALKSSVQFSEQRSIGDELLTDESFSVAMWGLQEALSYGKFLVRTAVTANDRGETLRNPYGSYPGFNSGIVEDYNRRGEISWKIGISYDFSALGLDGVTAYSDYIQGNRAEDSSRQSLPDKDEIDINIDYRVKEGWLKNFWLRVRAGFVHEDTVGTTKDLRVIVNYDLPII